MISNLLSNAIKFSNEGIISVTAEKKDNEVPVSIKDNGAGIDAEIVPRLFTKFATISETGGSGLGLFVSKCPMRMSTTFGYNIMSFIILDKPDLYLMLFSGFPSYSSKIQEL